MRTTQFIGLTKLASDFVKNLKELPTDKSTHGMFDEEIVLRKWEINEKYKNDRDGECIREVVQEVPWSSGPMIFTCLEFDFGNEATEQFCQWIKYPGVSGQEYDAEKGYLWV